MDYIVWNINETEEELRQSLQHPEYFEQKVKNLKPGSRRLLEVLAVRRALKELFHGEEQQVEYDEHGRPSLVSQSSTAPQQISISHTNGYAAVITSDHIVGIDIERRGRRVARVVSRFLKPEEVARLTLLSNGDNERFSLLLHVAWSAKETAFKVLGQRFFDLKNLTTIKVISITMRKLKLTAEGISNPFIIHFDFTQDYVLTWYELEQE